MRVGSRTGGLLALALAVSCSRPHDAPVPGDPRAAHASPLEGVEHVGSERCRGCHPAAFEDWATSSHALTVRNATASDEDQVGSIIACSGLPVTHVMGDRHHVRYLVEDASVAWGAGRWLALPCGFDAGTGEVRLHHEQDWHSLPWESSCAACHVTGFRDADHGFLELGIGCEECHGPGGRHVNTAARTDVIGFGGTAAQEVTLCASCHLQDGVSRATGHKFPHGFLPGGSLFHDFEFDFEAMSEEARARALDAHQKFLVRDVVFGGDDTLRCTSCHAAHGFGHDEHALLPKQQYCLHCHQDDMSLKEYSQSCNVCEF